MGSTLADWVHDLRASETPPLSVQAVEWKPGQARRWKPPKPEASGAPVSAETSTPNRSQALEGAAGRKGGEGTGGNFRAEARRNAVWLRTPARSCRAESGRPVRFIAAPHFQLLRRRLPLLGS